MSLAATKKNRGENETSENDSDVVYRTSEEIDAEYPNWLDGTTTESGKHSTQVEGSRKTYGKVGDWIEANMGKDVEILDASSGMGYGTTDPREEQINIPAVPRHYWRYRMHLNLEQLKKAECFNNTVRGLNEKTGR